MDSMSVLGNRKEISSGASDINLRLVYLSAHQDSIYKLTFIGLILVLISSYIFRENTNTGTKHIEMSRDSQFSSVPTYFWNYSRYHFQNSFNISYIGQMLSLVFSAVTGH